MKKLLLPFLFLLFLLKIEAQITFCPPGAKWNFRFEGTGSLDFLASYNCYVRYQGDSIVAGDTLKMLEYSSFFRSWELEQHPAICFIKQRGDTIFMRNVWTGNQWQILYNFAAQPGHSWINSFAGNSRTCTTTVNSIDTVLLNNKSVRRLKVTHQVSAYLSYGGYILEHMGSDAYLFNYRFQLSSDVPVFKEPLCYCDNTIGIVQFGAKPCNYSDPVGVQKYISNPDFKIYPNPVSSELNIDAMEGAQIIICDVNGKVVKQEMLNESQTINASNLIPGIYFLQVRQNNELVYKTKIVKE